MVYTKNYKMNCKHCYVYKGGKMFKDRIFDSYTAMTEFVESCGLTFNERLYSVSFLWFIVQE